MRAQACPAIKNGCNNKQRKQGKKDVQKKDYKNIARAYRLAIVRKTLSKSCLVLSLS